MPTPQERTALIFLVALALTAAGVRAVGVSRFEADVARGNGGQLPAPDVAGRALAAQEAAVDSAARAPKRRKGRAGNGGTKVASSRSRKSPTLSTPTEKPPPVRVDVNTASAEELERLPRVGPALAKRIVEWRTRHGPFQNADDLRHVRGIGPSTVRLLDSLVTFSGGHRPLDSEGYPSPDNHSKSVY